MYQLNQDGHSLISEWVADQPNVRDKIERIREGKPYKAIRRAGAKFPKQIVTHFKTDRGNRYMTISTFRNRSDVFAKTQSEVVIAILLQPDGRYRALGFPINMKTNKEFALEYCPHLFEQYADRMETLKRGIPLMEEFFMRNCYFNHADGFERPGDDSAIMMTCKDGACFGTIDGRKTTLVTFISSKTMQYGYKSQFDLKHDAETIKILEEIDAKPHLRSRFELRHNKPITKPTPQPLHRDEEAEAVLAQLKKQLHETN